MGGHQLKAAGLLVDQPQAARLDPQSGRSPLDQGIEGGLQGGGGEDSLGRFEKKAEIFAGILLGHRVWLSFSRLEDILKHRFCIIVGKPRNEKNLPRRIDRLREKKKYFPELLSLWWLKRKSVAILSPCLMNTSVTVAPYSESVHEPASSSPVRFSSSKTTATRRPWSAPTWSGKASPRRSSMTGERPWNWRSGVLRPSSSST